MVNVKLDLVIRVHGGAALKGIAVDEKAGKLESHVMIPTTGTPSWRFDWLHAIKALSPLNVNAAGAIPTKAECVAALNPALGGISAVLGVDANQAIAGPAHYWNGVRWVAGNSPLAFQYAFLLLQAGIGGMSPFEQVLVTGQGGATSLVLDLVLVVSP